METKAYEHNSYKCSKCSHTEFETGVAYVTGGFWSKFFDVQGTKFTTVTCGHCRYTEFYKADKKTLENVFDFLAGG